MTILNRRRLIASLPASVLAGSLAACTTTREGTATSHTINVAKIAGYLDATLKGANTVLKILNQFPALVAYTETTQVYIEKISAVSTEFEALTEGQLTVDYNTASVHTIVDSIFNLFGQFASLIKTVIVNMGSDSLGISEDKISKIEIIYNAVSTLVSIMKTMLFPSYARTSVQQPVSLEKAALRTLNA